VLKYVPPAQALSQLVNISMHDKDRLRAAALRLLAENVTTYHSLSPSTLKKTLFPAVSKTIFHSSTKADVRVAAAEVLKAMQTALGSDDSVCMWVSDFTQREEVKRLTAGS